jgi:hypothetical protein
MERTRRARGSIWNELDEQEGVWSEPTSKRKHGVSQTSNRKSESDEHEEIWSEPDDLADLHNLAVLN